MKLSYGVLFATQLLTVLALPNPNKGKVASSTTTSSAAAATTTVAAGAGTAGEEEKDPNEVNLTGQFGVKVNLGGGNIKTDTLFPPGVSSHAAQVMRTYKGTTLTVAFFSIAKRCP